MRLPLLQPCGAALLLRVRCVLCATTATDVCSMKRVLLCSSKHKPAVFLPGTKLHAYGHLRLRSLLAVTRLPAGFQPAPCLLQFNCLDMIPACFTTVLFCCCIPYPAP
jgi:hypothetical protein